MDPKLPPPPPDIKPAFELDQAVSGEPQYPAPIPGYLTANDIHILGGSPGAGKSTLLAQLAASLTTGEAFFGLQVNRVPVHYILTDRPEASNRRPREAAGVLDVPWVGLVDNPTLAALDLSLHMKRDQKLVGLKLLDAALEELKPPKGSVVIVDVMSTAFLGDVHRQHSLGVHMRQIARRCVEKKLTIIGTVYGVKTTGDPKALYSRPIDRIVGAQSMRGSAATIMYLCHPLEGLAPDAPPSYDQEFHIQSRDKELKVLRLVNKGLFVLSDEAKKVEEHETRRAIHEGRENRGLDEGRGAPRLSRVPLARDEVLPLLPTEFTDLERLIVVVREGWRPDTSKQYLCNILRKLEEEGRVERGEEKGHWRRVERPEETHAVLN